MERVKEYLLIYRKQWILIVIGLVLLLAYGGHSLLQNPKPNTQPVRQQKVSRQSARPCSAKICVDVKGAVSRPGVYYLPKSSRVKEAVDAAGGAKPEADMKRVNLAKQLQDSQVVYIPTPGEQLPAGTGGGAMTTGSNGSDSSKEKINLNSASKADLQKIDGVGDKKADKIIEYRQQHGQFKSVDELKNISGFGEKTVAKMKDQLAV